MRRTRHHQDLRRVRLLECTGVVDLFARGRVQFLGRRTYLPGRTLREMDKHLSKGPARLWEPRHRARMRVPWRKTKPLQLDLLDADPAAGKKTNVDAVFDHASTWPTPTNVSAGQPLIVSTKRLFEDPNNPRTEFPEAELEELAEDIRRHGILQPIVVHPVNAVGRHRIHFGANTTITWVNMAEHRSLSV